MHPWGEDELRHADLGDKRLNKRFIWTVAKLAARPEASVPEACDGWAETKAIYRFWSSRVKPEAIRHVHQQSTLERDSGLATVLVVQDTTDVDFTHHPATQGLGYLDIVSHQGLKMHSALAVSVHGVPLGLLHQEVWARDAQELGKRHSRRQRETKEKESQRWLSALQATQEAVPQAVRTITIADQEADIYDLMVLPRRAGSELLIRACHDRRVSGEARYLWETIRRQPVLERYSLNLQRKEDKPARVATVGIRYGSVEIAPPRHRKRRAELKAVRLNVVLVEEEEPPAEEKPIRWLLLSTLPIDSLEAAKQAVHWYTFRWLIERYHYVLKSGCRVEHLQLETADRLQRALATYCVVAWRLLWLTYEARRAPDTPCDQILSTEEWQCLYSATHRSAKPPTKPPTLHEAVRWIAQLGGFLGRKHDGEPGVKTIWRGLARLNDIMVGWSLAHPQPST